MCIYIYAGTEKSSHTRMHLWSTRLLGRPPIDPSGHPENFTGLMKVHKSDTNPSTNRPSTRNMTSPFPSSTSFHTRNIHNILPVDDFLFILHPKYASCASDSQHPPLTHSRSRSAREIRSGPGGSPILLVFQLLSLLPSKKKKKE